MTVADLIEELKRMPQYYPVMVESGLQYAESIEYARASQAVALKSGPYVAIVAQSDPRNY